MIGSMGFPAGDYKVSIGEVKQIYDHLMKKRHSEGVVEESAVKDQFFHKDGLLDPRWTSILTFLKRLQLRVKF